MATRGHVGPGNTPLLIAGGGGGGSFSGDHGFDGGGITTSGGGGGSGGQVNTNTGGAGGGGGGLSADGSAGPSATLTGSPPSLLPGGAGGQAFVNGAAGGAGGLPGSDGGFGGGGGGGVGGGGGGGGGYTGGNGGDGFITINSGFGFPANDSGGGGTSFDAGTNQQFSVETGFGDGVVMIAPPPPTIMPETPSVVEVNQTTDIATVTPGGAGDTLTLTQTGGSGTLILGPVQADGTQQVIYTAPGSVPASTTDAVSYQVAEQQDGTTAFGSASVQLDSGPTITAVTPVAVGPVQITEIGTVTPGLPSDTLTLTQTSPTANGTVSLQNVNGAEEVIYTAPALVTQSTTVAVSYQISDQHADASASESASVQLLAGLPPPPMITPETPSVVEAGQTTDIATVAPGVAGDTLTLSRTGGSGTLILGPVQADGTQQVIYTAPASVTASMTDAVSYLISDQQDGATVSGSGSVTLDSGPALTAVTPAAVGPGQRTEIGTVAPGLPGDTLTLTQTSPTANGTVSLQSVFGIEAVMYTAPTSITASTMVPVSYQISDQHADASASGSASVQLRPPPPTITPETPSVVEAGQTTDIATVAPGVAGDTLTLTQTGGSGTLSLGPVQADGTQQVIYTAPHPFSGSTTYAVSYQVTEQQDGETVSGSGSVLVDAGPTLQEVGPPVLEPGQRVTIGFVTPGLPGDTLTLTQTSPTTNGTVSLQTFRVPGGIEADVIYTAPAVITANTTVEVTFQIFDQHADAGAGGDMFVHLQPSPPTITPETPSVVEAGQTTDIATVAPGVAGDTLTLSQTGGSGTLSLGPVQADGTQQVIYTAPHPFSGSTTYAVSYQVTEQQDGETVSGSGSVLVDAGPTITGEFGISVLEPGQRATIVEVTPGLPGDTLTLTQTSPTANGTVSLQPVRLPGGTVVYDAVYTAPAMITASTTVSVSFQIFDQHADVSVGRVRNVQLDAGPAIAPVVPVVVEKGQSTEIGTVTPGLPGDTLTLTQTSQTAGGIVSLQLVNNVEEVIYTAPASIPASTTDAVSYSVHDQLNNAVQAGVVQTCSATVQLDAGPAITPVVPVVVEKGQSTEIGIVTPGLPGDTLTLAQTSPTANGTVSLQNVNGVEEVIYTAPASITASTTVPASYQISDQHADARTSGSANVQLDAGPTVTALAVSSVQNGQSTEIATVTPGLSTDTLTLKQTSPSSNGTVSLELVNGVYEVIYTAPGNLNSSPTEQVTYSVIDQHNDAVALGTAFVGGNTSQSVTANGDTTVILGGGNDTVALSGASNAVFLGNGNDNVTVSGGRNTISLGSGNDIVQGGAGDTIQLTGKGNLTVLGKSELVFLGGSQDIVTDVGQGLKLNIGPTAGNDSLANFASDLSSGIIDLLGGIGGYTSASQAYAALQNDGHGGALLRFGLAESLDIVGVRPSQLSANNIHIG
jgi:hypothetical protein